MSNAMDAFTEATEPESLGELFTERRSALDQGILTRKELVEMLVPKLDHAVPSSEEVFRMLSATNARVKFGIDPTWSEIHLGHTLPINVCRILSLMWHEVHLIIGDFTATVWDPTGRSNGRDPLSKSQVEENSATYKNQMRNFIELEKVEVVRNSRWLDEVWLAELLGYFQNTPLSAFLQREDFRKRLSEWRGVSMAELLYPILMAIDSIKLDADIEVGGRDQFLNFQITRDIMRASGKNPEAFVTTPILPWITGNGEKMSKTLKNYISLRDDPASIFGKIMSIPDELIELYVANLADVTTEDLIWLRKIIGKSPFAVKKSLAYFMVSKISGNADAWRSALMEFERRVSKKEYSDDDFILVSVPAWLNIGEALFSTGKFSSKSEIRRLLQSNSISIGSSGGDLRKTDGNFVISEATYVKIGKRLFIKFKPVG